jgi:glycine dehydrogenase subunit 1
MHEHKAWLIATLTEALSLAYVRGPGEFGADIFAGEGQSFGLYPQAGGPHLGLFSVKKDFMRSIPGRIVGQTQELWPKSGQDKQKGYVLTLATREQHIRRERATSNICTNQGVLAIRAAIYLALNGGRGLFELAELNHLTACRLRHLLDQSSPWQVVGSELPIFNEFLVKTPFPAEDVVQQGQFYGILPGVPLSRFYPERTHELVISVTERIREHDIQAYLDFANQAAPLGKER